MTILTDERTGLVNFQLIKLHVDPAPSLSGA